MQLSFSQNIHRDGNINQSLGFNIEGTADELKEFMVNAIAMVTAYEETVKHQKHWAHATPRASQRLGS